jgi:hypothetical protein
MNSRYLKPEEIAEITRLRQTGHSLPEIKRIVKRGYGTVNKYIKNVEILPGYRSAWEIKRGGNTRRAEVRWQAAEKIVKEKLSHSFSTREHLLIAACLYWGEGTKLDFGFTNSDPRMIKSFIRCLETLNVPKTRLRVSIRIYEDIDRKKAIAFWAKTIGIHSSEILSVNVLPGTKLGKLEFGMCRIRITKGQDVFKILQSAIKSITVQLDNKPL